MIKYHFFSFFIFILASAHAQKQEAKYIFASDTVYSDRLNSIAIVVPKQIRKSVKVKASQGEISTNDYQLYFLGSLKNGFVNIELVKPIGSKMQVLEKWRLLVLTSQEQQQLNLHNVSFSLTLNGIKEGKIADSIIKNVTMIDAKPYTILEAVVYFTDKYLSNPTPFFIKSPIFNSDFLLIWKKIRPGTKLIFDEIKFKDGVGNLFIYPRPVVFDVE